MEKIKSQLEEYERMIKYGLTDTPEFIELLGCIGEEFLTLQKSLKDKE